MMTNDEWDQAPWYRRALAVVVGNIGCLLFLGVLILAVLLVVHFLTAVPIKIYLAAIVVILLIVAFRKRSMAG